MCNVSPRRPTSICRLWAPPLVVFRRTRSVVDWSEHFFSTAKTNGDSRRLKRDTAVSAVAQKYSVGLRGSPSLIPLLGRSCALIFGRQCSKARRRTRVSPPWIQTAKRSRWCGCKYRIKVKARIGNGRAEAEQETCRPGAKLIGARLRWKLQIDGQELDPWLFE